MSGSAESWEPAGRIAWGPAPYPTVFRALWNETGLYVCFEATDDSPWFTMTGRDDHLWEEEVVEIFLDPARSGRNYAELEINPANVVCDVLMREPWPKQHSDLSWNIAGLETRVTELVHAGSTTGWCAYAFIPWTGLVTLPDAERVSLPPAAGDTWDFNVFRIKRPGGLAAPAAGAIFAAWSPPRGASFHDVERFGEMGFVDR